MTSRPRLFYGWLIVFVSAVGLFLGPPLMVFSFSVFFKSLVLDFHASRAAVSFAFSLFNLVGALLIPCTGMLIDRFGAKRVILVFTVLYGLGLCSALWVGTALWQLYLLFTVLGVAMASGPAPVPYGVVISHWFNRHRGLALGLSMMGIGIGSVVVPILAQRLITIFGWRSAFAIFGGAVILLPLPILAALLQNDPGQRGLQPDGDDKTPASQLPPQDKQGLTWHEIWHTSTFWILICIFSLAGAAVHGAALHMSAIFTDRGVTAERAAIATALVGIAVMLGPPRLRIPSRSPLCPSRCHPLLRRNGAGNRNLMYRNLRAPRTRRFFPRRTRHGRRGRVHGLHDLPILRSVSLRHRLRARLRRVHAFRSGRRVSHGCRVRLLPLLYRLPRTPLRGNGTCAESCSPASDHTATESKRNRISQ